jgi:hypothetical protein
MLIMGVDCFKFGHFFPGPNGFPPKTLRIVGLEQLVLGKVRSRITGFRFELINFNRLEGNKKSMPSFAYTARETVSGREIRNTVEAANEQTAIAALLNRNLLVVSIQEKVSKKGKTQGGKVALADLVVFTRQFATMIEAGIAIVQTLQALADQTPNKIMRDVIRDVCSRVESGDSFSEALLKHPKTFNKLYTSMVAAGEKGGLLSEIMARLATYLEKSERLRKKVKTALMYPTAVTVVAIGITIFLLLEVIPVFKQIFKDFGAPLPAPTMALLAVSDLVKKYILILIPAAGLGLAPLHQNQIRPRILGWPPHQTAHFRPHRAQNLPGPFHPYACFAGSQRRADSGCLANCLPNRRQRRHGKSHQDRRQRH